ncbi:MAG: hypothetical protein ACR2NP_11565 [Pirellulaceae bacterium]
MKVKTGIMLIVASAVLLPAGTLSAQQFKLPNLLPFRKSTNEVQPFKLTDQSRGQSRVGPQRPLFGLMQPRQNKNNSGQPQNPLAGLNQRSKQFFAKAGENFSQFASDLREHESPGWGATKIKPWWSHYDDSLPRLTWPQRPQANPPLMPRARSAQGYGTQPRHRF